MVELARRVIQLAREVKLDTFVAEARYRDDCAEMVPTLRPQSRLLAQLALGAFACAFPRAAASGGNFPDPPTYRMAPLAKKRHPAMLIKRHNRAGTRMAHDRQVNRHAIGQFRLLDT